MRASIVRALPFVLAVALPARPAPAQDHEGCPLHKAHAAADAVGHRHQEATGLPSDGIEHHFFLSAEGGAIRLEVKDARQTEERARVRAHLQEVARSFAAGDFSMPEHIHDQVPPGVATMKARRDAIHYTFTETPNGGSVAIATADPVALGAIHDFLRFQIGDHGTGDPIR
jgi:hypothetical protein